MRTVERTLAEQMQITEREIDKRKMLLGLSDKDAELLRAHKPFINHHIDEIVRRFYEKQTSVPEISLLIGDAETLRRLQSSMRRYVLELFDGYYDADYVNRRLRIGKVHKRIGVSPKLYISAVYLLQSIVNEIMDNHLHDETEGCIERLRAALSKLFMFDIQLVFDTYIASLVDEVSSAKEELENYAATLEETIAERTMQLEELSRKDMLTGIYNQRAFYENLRRELANAERFHEPITLAYFDLNGFKRLNDEQGHKAGDEVLSKVGQIMLESVRETDISCRYGGDEFCIIFPRTNIQTAEKVCQRLIKNAEKNLKDGVSFSLGLAETGPDDFSDIDFLVTTADKLMYKSKTKAKKKPGYYISVK